MRGKITKPTKNHLGRPVKKGKASLVKNSQQPVSTFNPKLLQNDEATQTEFVQWFLPIVTGYVSKTFPSLRLEAEDVALEAIYAALRNIGNFDPSKGALFS